MKPEGSTVFVTHAQNRFDYTAAEAFGRIRFVSDKVYSTTPGNSINQLIATWIAESADAYDPATDYILPSGSALITALFFVRLTAIGHRRARVLFWSHNEQTYSAGMVELAQYITQ